MFESGYFSKKATEKIIKGFYIGKLVLLMVTSEKFVPLPERRIKKTTFETITSPQDDPSEDFWQKDSFFNEPHRWIENKAECGSIIFNFVMGNETIRCWCCPLH